MIRGSQGGNSMEANQFQIYPSSEKMNDFQKFALSSQEKNKAFILFQKIQGAMRYIPDFSETCKAILEAVMDGMDAENCSLMLRDPVTGDLTIRAARGKNEKKSVFYQNSFGNGKKFKSGEGIAGRVLKEGKAVHLDDVNQEPHFVKSDGLNKVR